MKMIVGLGNPGSQYERTKHNVGFMVVDAWAAGHQATFSAHRCRALTAMVTVAGERVLLVKPQTFMNLSGEAVAALMHYYDVVLSDVLVVYDDLDLPLGTLRLRSKGSAGGHNGLKSIIQHLQTDHVQRLKVGIGRPFEFETVVQHVLSPFLKVYQSEVEAAIVRAASVLDDWVAGASFVQLMNTFHGK